MNKVMFTFAPGFSFFVMLIQKNFEVAFSGDCNNLLNCNQSPYCTLTQGQLQEWTEHSH